jgi:hypothetical protein
MEELSLPGMQVLVGSKLGTLGTEHKVACGHTIHLKLLK